MEYNGLLIYWKHNSQLDVYELQITKLSKDGWKQLKPFVEMLKALIPAGKRSYSGPPNHMWTLDSQAWDSLKTVMDALKINYREQAWNRSKTVDANGKPKIDTENFFYNTVPAATPETKESLSKKLSLLLEISEAELANPDFTKKAYRRKALQLHPDRNNGDGSKMSELNSVWSAYNA